MLISSFSVSDYSSPMGFPFRLTGGQVITTATSKQFLKNWLILQSGDNYKPPRIQVKNEWIKE